MSEVTIHNGEILIDVEVQPEAPSGLAAKVQPVTPEAELDPEKIAGLMAKTISQAQDDKCTPMETVNRILTLRTVGGQKLVWTKWDVRQLFALWSKKMEGSSKL